MKRNAFLFNGLSIIVSLMFASPLFGQDRIEKEITSALIRQQTYWNKGNIAGFMEEYKNTDSLKFVSSKGITKGYEAVLKRYLTSYSSTEKMGELNFEILEIKVLSPTYAFVIGKWNLTRSSEAGGNLGGFFTLLFERTSSGWKIIVDHTS